MDKKYIVDEIKRTANENNGVPLGMGKFARLTGIKETDWGKYWARYGALVIEAGYKPNKLTEAYDEKLLIEKLINFIQDIKKFPTQRKIKLKSFNDNDFPSHSTFQNRFGKKHEMAKKIVDYCKGKDEYRDVIEICKGVLASSKKEREVDSKEAEPQFGFVYLMKSGRYYKIGRSDSPEKRKYEIGTKLPEELKIVHKIRTDDPNGIEACWHKRFEEKRKRGEWFDLSSSDVKAFKRRNFM